MKKKKKVLSNLHFLSKVHSKCVSTLLGRSITITCAASLREDISRFGCWTEIFLNSNIDFNMHEETAKETSVTSIGFLIFQTVTKKQRITTTKTLKDLSQLT